MSAQLDVGKTASQIVLNGQLDAVIRVDDEAGKLIETHKQAGEFKEP